MKQVAAEQATASTAKVTTSQGGTIMSMYADLWRLCHPDVKGHGSRLLAAFLVSLGTIGATFCTPWFLAKMLDKALPAKNPGLFYQYAAAIIVSLVFFYLCSLLRTYLLAGASEGVFFSLRKRLLASLHKKPTRFFSQYEAGDLITRISSDSERLSSLVFDYVYASLNGLVLIALFVTLLLLWEWRLGLYTVLSLPCYVLLISLLQKPLASAANIARERLSAQNETMLDLLAGEKEIRFYQQFPAAQHRFAGVAEAFAGANARTLRIAEWTFNTMELFTRFISLAPFLLGGYWLCHGGSSITVGTLIAYNLYLTYISYSLEIINVGVTKLAQAAPLIKRTEELFAYPEEEVRQPKDVADLVDATRIEFCKVSFSYDKIKPVLLEFCLTIEPGEKVALMGPSGAGKSTLIDLLTRQISPDRGEILFGGRPLREYHLPLYLSHFAYVRQKPYLFRSTVRENIAAGWYQIPMDIIIDAATRVRMHETILGLVQGYETVIGMLGVELSGGQQQRVALARALVRDPEILLLDEFTSALDRATEEEILGDLLLNFQKQTIICVTHSEAVASHFSRIVRIEKR